MITFDIIRIQIQILQIAGENATIICKVGSVPKSNVRWYRDGNEVLNNSLSNRGLQRFLIFENGTFEGQSSLVLTNVRTDDSGQYKCVAANPAGKVEANFTLQVFKAIFTVGLYCKLKKNPGLFFVLSTGLAKLIYLKKSLGFLNRSFVCMQIERLNHCCYFLP